jgi:prefoldin alpha subunit
MTKENTKDKQKEMQKRYIEYQVCEQQLKQLQQQLEKLEMQTLEVNNVIQSVEDISKAKPGEEVLVPVTGGIFFKANMSENSRFLVNVGGGVVVDKDVEGTKKLLQEQAMEIEKYKEQIASQIAAQISRYQELEAELKKLVEE